MSIGIRAVTVYRPEKTINNIEQGKRLDANEDFIKYKIGMLQLSSKENVQETSDLASMPAIALYELYGLRPEQVNCLLLVTQNPDAKGLPHTSAILHQKIGLPISCAVFDISLGCSGYVQGLTIIKAFMESQQFKNGLLITCDPYSKIIDRNDRDTSLLFGDGATATWMSDELTWKVGPADFGILSEQNAALAVNTKGKLSMNGRSIFNFALTQIPKSVSRVLEKSGLNMQQIDIVLLHQGSRYIVEALSKRLGSEGKTPFAASRYGNTVSSSIPMLLAEIVPETSKRLLLSGFGVGLAWATCILEKKQ